MLHQYFDKITELIDQVQNMEKENLLKASEKIAECIKNGGIIHLFGCGHSHILTEEVFYRAGGLVPIRPILIEPLMLHQGAVRSSELERKNDYAIDFMKKQDIRSGDIVFVISTSGRNPVPIDVALMAKEKGAEVIGITSLEYSQSQPSRHVSGKHLFNSVDIVIDNHSAAGDAIMRHDAVSVPFGPSSTVIGAAILNAILVQTINLLANEGANPPVFLSGNVDGADQHNKNLIEKYKSRIPLLS